MRNISFNMTTDQVIRHEKAVTRRFGWDFVKPDEHLQGVNKCQGLKKGEHPVKLAEIVVLDSHWEPLDEIIRRPVRKAKDAREWRAQQLVCGYRKGNECTDPRNHGPGICWGPCDNWSCPGIREVSLEGFPCMTEEKFVEMLIKSHRGATPDTPVNRIAFEYVVQGVRT